MQFVGKVISSVSEFYRDINPSTLSGAIDVVVVEDVKTGELTCSPFHVRFGKLQLLRPQEKAVELKINGVAAGEELRMKVGEAGETFFVLSREELGMGGSDLPLEYLTSPLVGPETPAPLESIDEFKLATVSNVNSNLSAGGSNTSLAMMSPEWKWEWGDLPIKKSDIGDDNDSNLPSAIPVQSAMDVPSIPSNILSHSTTPVISSLPEVSSIVDNVPTVELYEYLTGKDYLTRCHDILSRLPPRSMITRIYRIDRGLYFNSLESWPDQLGVLLNESLRVLESDFLLNPNLVIEESSRLVYQFSWENRKVLLSGSVGAAVVFYAQTYARTLPVEIVQKLAEVAAIRMAKRKFNKSAVMELEEELTTGMAGLAVLEGSVGLQGLEGSEVFDFDTVTVGEAVEERAGEDHAGESHIESSVNTVSTPHDTSKSSSWRSWWSRSSASHSSVNPTATSANVPIPVSPLLNVSGGGSPKLSLSGKPATLSDLINGVDDSGSGGDIGRESPVKRIIHRTTSISSISMVNVAAATGGTNDITSISSDTSSIINSVASLSNSASIANSINNASINNVPSSPTGSTKRSNAQCIKSLRLPSHLLKKLNLNPGVNSITYTVNTRLQGTATCQSRIFLWRSDSRVVISDIDGTITKSDALGHLFTMVGKDWTHVGVAQLYSKIAGNGYEFLYLTSRAIGQAASTRGYLKAVEQDRLQLPDGPVIMSPDRLFTALHREVIQRRPDEFKIACLRDIQKLFVADEEEVSMMGSGMVSSSEDEYSGLLSGRGTGTGKKSTLSAATASSKPTSNLLNNNDHVNLHQNPFYAGFGNRPTDTKSYKAVGISASRIFLINPAGDLKLDKLTFYTPYSASSYSKLTEEVDKVFPPVRSPCSLTRVAGDEAFTDLQYWHGQGGDVRMDLVQQALGTISTTKKNNRVLTDVNGKPVSPVTLQKQLGSSTASIGHSSGTYSSSGAGVSEMFTISPSTVASTSTYKSGEEADSEDENQKNGSDDEDDSGSEGEGMDSMDSFPFI